MGRRKQPIDSLGHKTGPDRIGFDILQRLGEMIFVAHEAVEIVRCPERSRFAGCPVDRSSGESLPGLHEIAYAVTFVWIYYHVNVVWHDAPSQEIIPRSIKREQRLFDDLRRCRIEQGNTMLASIQQTVDRCSARRWIYRERFRQKFRQAAIRSEDDVLYGFRRVKMRNVSTRVPTLRSAFNRHAIPLGLFVRTGIRIADLRSAP